MSPDSFSRRGFVSTSLAGLGLASFSVSAQAEEVKNPPEPRGPFVYPFRIGEVEAWSISDADLSLGQGLALMWPEEERPVMKDLLEKHGEAASSLPLYVNVLVIRTGTDVILFDAGFGAKSNPRMGWLKSGLEKIGIAPEQVTAGFLSHAHSDHIDGFVEGEKPTFPNAKFHVMSAELNFWNSANPDFSKSKRDKKPLPGMVASAKKSFAILAPLTVKIEDGMEFYNGLIRAEAAPGHTSGHVCFRILSGGEEFLHLMDLAHHHLLMFADPRWTIAFDHDPEQAVLTRQKFWSHAAENHTRCFGFHLPWPGIGRIVAENEGYRWWAEAWKWQEL
jgi:glyoxylase-like metal-dependent hydrolase (beta-lactamase superfamily II)